MREEQVTKAILDWLVKHQWRIVCFDFPQSGTGKVLHPNDGNNEKNKKSIIPDIVAVKGEIAVFFENKDRFYLADYKKQNSLKVKNEYSNAINRLLEGYNIQHIYYGIGLPTCKHSMRSKEASVLVDFILTVEANKDVHVAYAKERMFD